LDARRTERSPSAEKPRLPATRPEQLPPPQDRKPNEKPQDKAKPSPSLRERFREHWLLATVATCVLLVAAIGGLAGLAIDQPILSEVILTLGCVPLAAYGTPSTEELTQEMQPFVKHHNALLMANHGAVAYGADLWQAWDRLETLEHTAKIAILSRMLGGSKNLPADAIEKLINVREQAGYLGESARGQACGYLRESPSENGAGKISLTREELVELLSQAVNGK